MIYDCFIFNNELDILDIRFHELTSVVDKFVLVESTVTHTNKKKKLYFEQNKSHFKEFKDKIIHIIVKDTPNVNQPWIINDFQFSQMARGLQKCKNSDIILFSDVDEIPRAQEILNWKNKKGDIKVFNQLLCHYYLNFIDFKHPWYGTRMCSFKNLTKYSSIWIAKFSPTDAIVPNGGWHFTYMGGIKKIQEKLTNTIHQELNISKYNTPEKILLSIRKGKDPFEFGRTFAVASNNYLPDYVVNNPNKFKNMLLDKKLNNNLLVEKFRTVQLETLHLLRAKLIRKVKKYGKF